MNDFVFKDNSAAVKAEFERRIHKALEHIGLIWLKNVTNKVPVDTGRLRSSMKYEIDIPNKRVILGTDVLYAVFVELGTRNQRAQPYLSPSILNHIADYEKAVRETLGSGWSVEARI